MGDAFIIELNVAVDYLKRHFSLSGDELKQLEEVKPFNEMSQMIRARLNEAEEMEINYESARLCLKILKKNFHAVEDVRDEFI